MIFPVISQVTEPYHVLVAVSFIHKLLILLLQKFVHNNFSIVRTVFNP